MEQTTDSKLKQVGVSDCSQIATLMLCKFVLEYGFGVKRSCSWPLFSKCMMTVLISISTIQKL
jgi:hypothetical protein